MPEDDQSTLNCFSFSICNLGWYCFHELLEISLANWLLLPALPQFLFTVYLSKWFYWKVHRTSLVGLSLNIPLVVPGTVIIMSVVVSGPIEGKLRFLHLRVLSDFNRFSFFFLRYLFGVIWYEWQSHTVFTLPWQFSVVLGTVKLLE